MSSHKYLYYIVLFVIGFGIGILTSQLTQTTIEDTSDMEIRSQSQDIIIQEMPPVESMVVEEVDLNFYTFIEDENWDGYNFRFQENSLDTFLKDNILLIGSQIIDQEFEYEVVEGLLVVRFNQYFITSTDEARSERALFTENFVNQNKDLGVSNVVLLTYTGSCLGDVSGINVCMRDLPYTSLMNQDAYNMANEQ